MYNRTTEFSMGAEASLGTTSPTRKKINKRIQELDEGMRRDYEREERQRKDNDFYHMIDILVSEIDDLHKRIGALEGQLFSMPAEKPKKK